MDLYGLPSVAFNSPKRRRVPHRSWVDKSLSGLAESNVIIRQYFQLEIWYRWEIFFHTFPIWLLPKPYQVNLLQGTWSANDSQTFYCWCLFPSFMMVFYLLNLLTSSFLFSRLEMSVNIISNSWILFTECHNL